ncbi:MULTISPECIES: response regulator transcription factor [unclassified Devosia]|uniref:response regulator transcription factor n=1 Tax=unclassified Devosia TaxID=196773 RepID=UPI00145D718A|nr:MULTISPECIES: response regulator transcription factor [unclassified Devosia]MBJ6988752.1 response regulator transcription factor [Devosia sp. MC521]QMW63112.1 response regulator transcription factor [Devosia sp. MC521]
MRILIADDHAMFGSALHYLLQASDPDCVVKAVTSVAQLLGLLKTEALPDLVLLDYSMPDTDGIRAVAQLRELYPDLPVAILSGHTDNVLVKSALDKGARGWIPKNLTPKTLIHALRLILDGERFVPPELLVAPAEQVLSEREGEVALLLAEGKSDKIIADRLGIEPSTVKVHVRRILQKSGATNRAHFAALNR